MSVKMRKINPLSGGKNIVVILKLNIPETEGATTQLNTEQDNLESLEDGRWYLELLGVGLSFQYQFPNQTNQTTNIRYIQYQYQFLSLRSKNTNF